MNWHTISTGLKEAAPIFIGIISVLALLFTIDKVLLMHPQLTPDEEYFRAVRASVQPDPSWVSHSLRKVNLNESLTVVSWMTENSVSLYKGGVTPDKDTWVTVASDLKSFCQEFVRSHGPDPDQLDLRLKQRLGLPPQSKYTHLVELTIDPVNLYGNKNAKADPKLFRPCADPSLDTDSCTLARDLPAADSSKPDIAARPPRGWNEVNTALKIENGLRANQYWFLSKYYGSFASVPGYQYPWTSLGYTFDWAPKDDASDDFVRRGEDEYVLKGKTELKFVSKPTPTLAYCTPD